MNDSSEDTPEGLILWYRQHRTIRHGTCVQAARSEILPNLDFSISLNLPKSFWHVVKMKSKYFDKTTRFYYILSKPFLSTKKGKPFPDPRFDRTALRRTATILVQSFFHLKERLLDFLTDYVLMSFAYGKMKDEMSCTLIKLVVIHQIAEQLFLFCPIRYIYSMTRTSGS